jgi:hypothetical protein
MVEAAVNTELPLRLLFGCDASKRVREAQNRRKHCDAVRIGAGDGLEARANGNRARGAMGW